jgi:hypothetical protein
MTQSKQSFARKVGGGAFLRRLLFIALLIYVIVNPLSAAMNVHDVAYWIRSLFP